MGFRALGVVALCVSLSGGFSARLSVAGEASDRLKAALHPYRATSLTIAARGLAKRANEGLSEPPVTEESVVSIRIGDGRSVVSRKKLTRRPGDPPWRLQNDFVTYADGSVLNCQAALDETFSQAGGVDNHMGLLLWNKELAAHQAIEDESVYRNLADYECLLWWIGRTPLTDYLGDDAQIEEESAGDDRVQITAASPFGTVVLRLGHSSGWLPEKFRVTKLPTDRCFRGTIGDEYMPQPSPPDPSDVYPADQQPPSFKSPPEVLTITWEGEATQFEQSNESHPYARRLRIVQAVNYASGPPQITETEIELESIDFTASLTSADLETQLKFPVGTRVSVAGAEHLPIVWDGTRPVVGIPADTSRHREPMQPLEAKTDWRLLWLVGVNVLLGIVLIVVFIRRKRRPR